MAKTEDIDTLEEFVELLNEEEAPKKRGRPRKIVEETDELEESLAISPNANFPAQLVLKVKLLTKTAKLPVKAHDSDSGFDLFVDDFISPYPHPEKDEKDKNDGDVDLFPHYNLHPGEIMKVKTGVAFGFPEGYGGFLEGRSSLAGKGIDVLGGVCDQSYVGEIIVCLSNSGLTTLKVERGQKIAQMVLLPVPLVRLEQVKELGKTERGEKGFGSSGQ